MNKIAVYAGTRNTYHKMAVAAKSLLIHTAMDKVIFLTEDDELDEPLPDVIQCVNVSNQTYFKPDGPNYSSRWTYMSMMRLALPIMFPEEQRMLWLDIDTIVDRDISELFETDLNGCYIGAAIEPERCVKPFVYFNAGVLLEDLEKLRDGKCLELIDYINRNKLSFPDQDVYNILCQGRIKPIDPIYNSSICTDEPDNRKILHFAAEREYNKRFIWMKYEAAEWSVK